MQKQENKSDIYLQTVKIDHLHQLHYVAEYISNYQKYNYDWYDRCKALKFQSTPNPFLKLASICPVDGD